MKLTGLALPGTALAHRDDFELAAAAVRPSIRTIAGPGGTLTLEPKIMMVLIAFVDAAGAVVTRDDLIRECWGGRIVGEDAVNRTIAELRRVARESQAGFTIETIPRIGFRLAIEPSAEASGDSQGSVRLTRRMSVASLAASAALIGGAAWWFRSRGAQTPETALVERGRRALYNGFPDSGEVASSYLVRAVEQSPGDAEAWGLLAFAKRDIAEGATPDRVSAAVEASAEAARRALDIDPNQGTALAALAMLRPYFGEFAAGEDRLMKALEADPDNVLAMTQLVALLQGVGRVRLSADWNERVVQLDPVSPVGLYRRANKLWAMGQLSAADLAADRAMQLWPRHPGVWNARMMIFAFSGRPEAGLTLLDEAKSRPATLKEPGIELWRVSLRALDSRSAADVVAARLANVKAAPRSPGFANNALMTLSMLGELDAAFDVAQGYFLRRGPLITTLWGGAGELPVSALRWRRTMALFVPPAEPMRGDPRFDGLMDDMGLTRYWEQRGVIPDYRLHFSSTSR